jgi:uncharacterized membrane protein
MSTSKKQVVGLFWVFLVVLCGALIASYRYSMTHIPAATTSMNYLNFLPIAMGLCFGGQLALKSAGPIMRWLGVLTLAWSAIGLALEVRIAFFHAIHGTLYFAIPIFALLVASWMPLPVYLLATFRRSRA